MFYCVIMLTDVTGGWHSKLLCVAVVDAVAEIANHVV